MTVTVDVHNPIAVTVHCKPSWWERWVLRRAGYDDATQRRGTNGKWYWQWDSTWMRVRDPRVLEAIERALRSS